eukprot:1327608-Amorphochlora_amoeboformis.AAC.1
MGSDVPTCHAPEYLKHSRVFQEVIVLEYSVRTYPLCHNKVSHNPSGVIRTKSENQFTTILLHSRVRRILLTRDYWPTGLR